jgi:hypothetical protein
MYSQIRADFYVSIPVTHGTLRKHGHKDTKASDFHTSVGHYKPGHFDALRMNQLLHSGCHTAPVNIYGPLTIAIYFTGSSESSEC